MSTLAAAAIAGPVEAPERAFGPGFGGLIPDNDAFGYFSPIMITDDFPISSLKVRILGLDHGYSGDLTIELRKDGSVTPTILVANLSNGADADFNGDYTFGDDGADLAAAADPLSGLEDIPSGEYRAVNQFGNIVNLNDKYAGVSARGAWTLRIADDDFLVSGSLEGWELVLGGAPDCLPSDLVADINGDGAVDLMDLNLILSNFGSSCAPG